MTLTDVDVLSVGRSRGRTETDAELIYAAKLHLDASAACNAAEPGGLWRLGGGDIFEPSFNSTGKRSSNGQTQHA